MEEDILGLSRIKKLKECLMEQQSKQNPVSEGGDAKEQFRSLSVVFVYADGNVP